MPFPFQEADLSLAARRPLPDSEPPKQQRDGGAQAGDLLQGAEGAGERPAVRVPVRARGAGRRVAHPGPGGQHVHPGPGPGLVVGERPLARRAQVAGHRGACRSALSHRRVPSLSDRYDRQDTANGNLRGEEETQGDKLLKLKAQRKHYHANTASKIIK